MLEYKKQSSELRNIINVTSEYLSDSDNVDEDMSSMAACIYSSRRFTDKTNWRVDKERERRRRQAEDVNQLLQGGEALETDGDPVGAVILCAQEI